MVSFDKGPPAALANHFAQLPDIPTDFQKFFWNDWGPVFYRGRLTGKARVLGIASDPGPTERVVGRTLVGDAGQRVQGFLDKLGLTRSYVLVNAFPVAVHPTQVFPAKPVLSDQDQLKWRNRFYDLVTGPDLQAIVAFGGNAVDVVDLWNGQAGRPGLRGPAPVQPRQRPAAGEVAYGDPGPARARHPRRGRVGHRTQLRHHLQGVRLPPDPRRGPPLRAAALGR